MFDNSSGKAVRQGHVPEAESLYFQNCKDDVKKRLRGTVAEGVFLFWQSFLWKTRTKIENVSILEVSLKETIRSKGIRLRVEKLIKTLSNSQT